jgi:hypothetical protein
MPGVMVVEATEDVAGAIMGDSVVAFTLITGDMAGGVILTGGTTLTIPTITVMVCAGVLDTGDMTPILGKGLGCLEDGFHATKRR